MPCWPFDTALAFAHTACVWGPNTIMPASTGLIARNATGTGMDQGRAIIYGSTSTIVDPASTHGDADLAPPGEERITAPREEHHGDDAERPANWSLYELWPITLAVALLFLAQMHAHCMYLQIRTTSNVNPVHGGNLHCQGRGKELMIGLLVLCIPTALGGRAALAEGLVNLSSKAARAPNTQGLVRTAGPAPSGQTDTALTPPPPPPVEIAPADIPTPTEQAGTALSPRPTPPVEAAPADGENSLSNHPGPLGSASEGYHKLLASTASLPSELLRTAYLVDTGTQITLVCSKENMTDVQPRGRPPAWASAAKGQSQQTTHRGTLTMQLVATDASVHTVKIPGVYYAESARLNAISPVDLHRAGVTLKLHPNEPEKWVVTLLTGLANSGIASLPRPRPPRI
jgi:hypothetical protein